VKASSWQIGGNAAGATNIHKANEEMIFSGLKSMPSVQGRSYSTTETYAGVAYDIIIRNTRKYQRAAKRVIESGCWLIAGVRGLKVDKINVKFNENRSINRQQEASAEAIEIRNAMNLWVLGILNQQGVSQRLGYAAPEIPMDEPPEAAVGQLTAHSIDTPPDTGLDFQNTDKRSDKMEDDDTDG
jgi:hypothetical protein